MSMPHAAILTDRNAFARCTQLRMTLCLGSAGLEAARGFLVRFGHLLVPRYIFGSVRINFCRRWRRGALACRWG